MRRHLGAGLLERGAQGGDGREVGVAAQVVVGYRLLGLQQALRDDLPARAQHATKDRVRLPFASMVSTEQS